MRFSRACLSLCLATTPLMAAAFVPMHQQQQSRLLTQHQPPLHVGGQGWEGDSFPDESEAAGIDGADITKEMIEKAKASHTEEEEATQGGSRFREMMKRAQSGPPRQMPPPPPPPPQQQPPPQPQYQQPYAAAAPPPPAQPVDPSNLSVEEQAAMFRQMMQQQQQQQQPQAPPPQQAYGQQPYADPYAQQQQQPPAPRKNFLPGGVDEVGRKIGRNRDADAIQNSADLYFAQLKQDSKTRNYARYRGDYEEANQVWKDPKIQEITIPVNPYLQEQQEKEKDMFETAVDEMITPEMFMEKPKKPESYSGISYRDKLKQRAGAASAAPAAAPAPVESAPPVSSTPPQAVAETPAAPAPVVESTPPPPPPPQPETAVAEEVTAPSVEAVAETKETWADKLQTELPEADASPIPPPPTSAEEEEKRREIRTLMGLILKHRGGPGFGAGRLQGAEAERMESLALGLTDFLKKEAQQFPQQGAVAQDLTIDTPPPPAPAASIPAPEVPVPVAPQAQAPPPAQQAPPAPVADGGERIQGLIACIEGAVQMYRNSPAELKEGVLITLRAALLSAVNTCNAVIGDTAAGVSATGGLQAQSLEGSYDPSKSQGERVDSLISCIEGAIQMYRNSPPELQSSVLVTLRAALMSGVATCNGIIAQNEMKNLEAYQATSGAPPPQTQVVEIPPVPIGDEILEDIVLEAISEEEAAAMEKAQAAPEPTPVQPATDANSLFFDSVLQKLKAAAGTGKMGLRSDLSAEEAEDLAESILDARSMLMDELDTGIPQASTATAAAVPSSASSSGAPSKYQQMLEKAKAEKANKQ